MYFKNAKVGDDVFGLVFGHGKITKKLNGFWSLLVTFDNGFEVPYDSEGIPAWGNFDYQTLFYKTDIDLEKLDFSSVDALPTPKKIIKWRTKGKLEIKCPSGLWASAKKCSQDYVETLLSEEKFWLFRKASDKASDKSNKEK